jgi:hypothetical protein
VKNNKINMMRQICEDKRTSEDVAHHLKKQNKNKLLIVLVLADLRNNILQ